ncbi:MAG TPA: sporulation protein [Herpetosiphonaceae bacterium]
MFKKMLASFGVGSASVETQLAASTAMPGTAIQGTVFLRGGDVEQQIDSLDIVLNTTYVRESDDSHWTETCSLIRQPITSRFDLQPKAQHTIPFSLPIPWETPLTIGHQAVTVYTDLNIAGGIDSTDSDYLQITPLPIVQRTLDAVATLGFRPYKTECKYHPRGHRYPFVQEFELRPAGHLAWRIEEIELVFSPGPHELEILLEVDRRGRGFGGWLESVTETNERYMRLRVPHNIDQQNLIGTLQNALNQAVR